MKYKVNWAVKLGGNPEACTGFEEIEADSEGLASHLTQTKIINKYFRTFYINQVVITSVQKLS